jgi:hypothetical protein
MKITATDALVTAVTTLGENHGEDVVVALAVRLECQVLPRMLHQFDRKLLPLLFTDDIPTVPGINVIKWKFEYEKAAAMIGGLQFAGADVKNIKISPRAGFLIDLGLTVKVYGDADMRGKLTGLIKKKVNLSLEKMTQKTIEEAVDEAEEQDPEDSRQGSIPQITPLLDKNGKPNAARAKH